MINDCQRKAIDNQWELARTNACHIAIQNEELGEVWKQMETTNYQIQKISNFQAMQVWLWAVIGTAIIVLVVKKMWGKNNF